MNQTDNNRKQSSIMFSSYYERVLADITGRDFKVLPSRQRDKYLKRNYGRDGVIPGLSEVSLGNYHPAAIALQNFLLSKDYYILDAEEIKTYNRKVLLKEGRINKEALQEKAWEAGGKVPEYDISYYDSVIAGLPASIATLTTVGQIVLIQLYKTDKISNKAIEILFNQHSKQ